MHRYSLNDLGNQIKEDLLLEGTMTIQVDVSIERYHDSLQDETGKTRIVLGPGYLVSLGLPATGGDTTSPAIFSDGTSQMICDLRYLGEDNSAVSIEEIIKALGIDVDAKIWKVKQAP
jgi:hypothetical protein